VVLEEGTIETRMTAFSADRIVSKVRQAKVSHDAQGGNFNERGNSNGEESSEGQQEVEAQ
jgi:hypothetical protein